MLAKGDVIRSEGREYTVLELLGKGASAAAYLALCSRGGLTSRCILKECISENKERFLASGRMQNEIRQQSSLGNQTPPVSHVFEADGTAFIDVACFGGTTLDRLKLTLPQYMALCLTIAKTVGYYHASGLLCLDLKPENIFVLQNAPDDTLTQLVEFIDFDSVIRAGEGTPTSYTAKWSAPEQRSAHSSVTAAADIFSIGELVFFLLFGRHSTEREHRGFSVYPFDDESCPRAHRRFTDRPAVRGLFTRLFRITLRSSAANRAQSTAEVASLLSLLVAELEQKDYIIPRLPSVPAFFVGRESELSEISRRLAQDRVLFLTGVGGIGKTALARAFVRSRRADCDAVIYLEFEGSIVRTFCDDMQLQLSCVTREDGESDGEYFKRKLGHLRRICTDKRVLLVIDDLSGRITKELSELLSCGFETLIVTRNHPPKNSFPELEVGALDEAQLMKLVSLDLGRAMTRDERGSFGEIISIVQGHTLVLELIARQIAAGRLGIKTARELIRQHGFSAFSDEQISSYKDGEEVYDTLAAIVSALFDAGSMTDDELLAIKTLALLGVRGLEADLSERILGLDPRLVQKLAQEGWLYCDSRVRLHPVVAETLRRHGWPKLACTDIMERHSRVIAFLEGTADAPQIEQVISQAELYKNMYSSHLCAAMLLDMRASLYDTLLGGAYLTENEQEDELLEKLLSALDGAIEEAALSDEPESKKYLAKYRLSLAGVLLRADPERSAEAKRLLESAEALIPESDAEGRCYLCMVRAWFFTLAEPDPERTAALTDEAEALARAAFKTDLERIDIVTIPAANCLFYHGRLNEAAERLWAAHDLCKQHPDELTYIDKQAELLCCLADVYAELGDLDRCRSLLAELSQINEEHRSDGICRLPSAETLALLEQS